jgi:protein involved in polysaccharide export with SLBB domain
MTALEGDTLVRNSSRVLRHRLPSSCPPSTRLRGILPLVLLLLLGAISFAGDTRAQQLPGGATAPSTGATPPSSTPSTPNPAGRANGTSAGSVLGLPPNDAELEGAVDPARYILGPGDGLVFSLVGRVALDAPLEIDPEGYAWIPEFGRLKLAGLTLDEARSEARKRFRGDARGVQVYMRLVRLRRFKVYVLGEVGEPGAVEASAVTRVSEAIRRAGGLTERASERNIELKTNAGTRVVDLVRFARLGDLDANPNLADGAIVSVPPRHRPISLHGPIAYPGPIEHRSGDKLSDLIALGGNFDPSAVLDRATLVRFFGDTRVDTVEVNLQAVLNGSADVDLQEGDRLFVPARGEYHIDRNVSISGEVARPGTYPLEEGVDRVSDLVRMAGGMTPEANARSVLVVRHSRSQQPSDPEFERLSRLSRSEMTDNEYQTFQTKLATSRAAHVVDMSPMAEAGADPRASAARERNILLEPGDAVIVERTSHAVRVAGEVRWPGFFSYDPSLTGDDYLKIAGGFTGRASSGSIRLTRSVSGQTLLLKDAGAVQPGDLIFVPEKHDVNVWGVVRDIILVAGSVAAIVIAIQNNQ